MGTWAEYPIGSENVPIGLVLNDFDGGVTGEAPTFRIRRATDNRYLDFNDNTFKLSGHTTIEKSLNDRGDGRYSYLWNSSLSIKTPTVVIVEYTNDTTPSTVLGVDSDVITFTNSATILSNLARTPLASVGQGSGSCRFVYTLTEAGSSQPITGATVYVTSDIGGANIIAGPSLTNESGKVTFYLDTGKTYYLWRSKGGITFSNPDVEQIV